MTRVVAVHGINNAYSGPGQMAAIWEPAILDGLHLARCGTALSGEDIGYVSYGDLYRRAGRFLGDDDLPWLEAEDIEDEFERELLAVWWRGASEVDPGVIAPGQRTLGPSRWVQSALAALACSRYLAGVTERMLIFSLKQVRDYFAQDAIRQAIQARFASQITPDTRVVVAHSLGSVVAYEALCANTQWNVTTLVTLGSPLGIRNLFFDRLHPRPVATGSGMPIGTWPSGVRRWTNITDAGDFAALVKTLRIGFGERVVDVGIDNGIRAHQVQRYLSAAETGAAICAGLAETQDGG